jgi:hypothetical protein
MSGQAGNNERPQEGNAGFVYVIRSSKPRLMKVGFSVNPKSRLNELQTGSSSKLDLMGVWPGTKDHEKQIHQALEEKHSHLEWFRVSYDEAAAVIREITGSPDEDLPASLELLQNAYKQTIDAGLRARTTQRVGGANGQIPVLTIQLWNVSKCPKCESWISGLTCPIC